MRYHVVTLFPELIEDYASTAILGKAQKAGRIAISTVNPRDFTHDRHRTVDDSPYGGGSGMVMMAEPLVLAMEKAELDDPARPHRVLLTPQGAPLDQARVTALAEHEALTLVCGRYEGIDERARTLVDEEISLGDFVLMGGELAALAVIEATARLVAGVLGNPISAVEESHGGGLLEHPQYTRPAEFRGQTVPEVLLSGNHAAIEGWRRDQAEQRTRARRPDLWAKHQGRAGSPE